MNSVDATRLETLFLSMADLLNKSLTVFLRSPNIRFPYLESAYLEAIEFLSMPLTNSAI
jgi:hypothetical protein